LGLVGLLIDDILTAILTDFTTKMMKAKNRKFNNTRLKTSGKAIC
jgi:hypothetical protein